MSISATELGLIDGRDCGPCVSCCGFFAIGELDKPAGLLCGHSTVRGCAIYQDRPKACRVFQCAWRCWDQVPEDWRPDRTGFILGGRLAPQDFLSVTVDPQQPDSWRADRYHRTLRQWAKDGGASGSPVVIFIASRVIVLDPEGEHDLGEIGPDEVLIRENNGTIRKVPRASI